MTDERKKPTPAAWFTPYFEANSAGKLVPLIVPFDDRPSAPKDWKPLYAADALDAAEARVAGLERTIEDARPHVDKIAACIWVNDEMGRVATGQTEAATALRDIFATAIRSTT